MLNNKISKAVRLAIAFGAASTAILSNSVMAAEEEKAEKIERVQVTGSRIRTDSFGSEVPVDIISIEDATNEGIKTLGDLLRTSTAAAGSNQVTSALSVGYVTAGGKGNESASLRGLGASRTLVLLNGRRAGPAGTRGQVQAFDLNTIPLSTIERVEILKDGASSLYGSDAVAGVINIITKKGDDKSVTVDISQPFESGGEERRINFSFGEEFDEGSFRVTADYKNTQELKRGQRDFLECGERLVTYLDGTSADPINPRTGKAQCAESGYGLWVYGGDDATNVTGSGPNLAYDYDGFFGANGYKNYNSTATGAGDLRTPNGWFPVSYDRESDGWWDLDHPFRDDQTMRPESNVWSIYAQGDYNLTDDITVYSEFIHSSRTTTTADYRQFWIGDVGAQAADKFEGFSGDAKLMPVAISNHYSSETNIDYTRAVIGIEGSIGFWNWDVSYQNSYNDGEYRNDIFLRDSLLMSQNHLKNGTKCNGEVTATSKKTCVDLPWADPAFLAGNQSAEVSDFINGVDFGRTTYKQQTFEAFISGELFELPAGAVGSAFGLSIQKDEIDDTPGSNTVNGNSWGLSGAGRTAGSQISRSVYGEVKVPLISDVFLVESLDLTGSARWTDVSTYGNDSTFKLGLNWVIVDGLSLRGSRGTSFRSPALYELYLADQSGFNGQTAIDPCLNWVDQFAAGKITELTATNCKTAGVPEDYTVGGSSATIYTSGGAGRLTAETAVNETVGLVWTSPENTFAASIDYFSIVISNEVTSLSGGQITGKCYESLDFANEPLCDLFTRRTGQDGDYGIDEVRSGYVNVATQNARGVDYKFTYNDDFDFGSIRFRFEHTMQIERKYKLFADSIENNEVGELGEPKHVGNVSLTYKWEDYSLTWTSRYADSTNNYEYLNDSNETTYRGEKVTVVRETPWVTYHSLSGSVKLDSGLDFTVGVANLFDREPPIVSSAGTLNVGNAALYSQYDRLGRRAFANITYKF
ncbi:TonB-dependent receptor [Pseudoalteromonas sp. NEC-BIFX-2020_015]|uniref:TonB-dependent receptor domain-containing protein n=1 Tax=Pseudoalteromonas sp. NEC-BIFX-2020_015 TaxID=2729544 RepID=UPI00146168E6|nr:TonB-dependent receptor [Pseudoalteromonas sp. NEC-BIFX-2020_015]NMR25272.1 TonB-dependent receptor [Pseudoalteromonas sp. NEC-BIFX-2020_015]